MLDKLLFIQHRFNPLHVHCRLVEKGLSKRWSLSICKCYEILFYSWIVWFSVLGIHVCRLSKLS